MKIAPALIGFIIGPVFAYLLAGLPIKPFMIAFGIAVGASFFCGLGIALRPREWRSLGFGWAIGVLVYAGFMLYLFSFLDDLPPVGPV